GRMEVADQQRRRALARAPAGPRRRRVVAVLHLLVDHLRVPAPGVEVSPFQLRWVAAWRAHPIGRRPRQVDALPRRQRSIGRPGLGVSPLLGHAYLSLVDTPLGLDTSRGSAAGMPGRPQYIRTLSGRAAGRRVAGSEVS